MNRKCNFCGKLLIKKKYKNDGSKNGYRLEHDSMFNARKYCDLKCKATDKTIWTKSKIISTFNKIESKNKLRSTWLEKHRKTLFEAISRRYGKNFWEKFLKEQGFIPIRSKQNPKHIRIARHLLKYFISELEIKPHEVFEFAHKWYVGIYDDNENVTFADVMRALYHLRDKKIIRLVKTGNSISQEHHHKQASTYALLKTRL
jgi:hypothetical protein